MQDKIGLIWKAFKKAAGRMLPSIACTDKKNQAVLIDGKATLCDIKLDVMTLRDPRMINTQRVASQTNMEKMVRC